MSDFTNGPWEAIIGTSSGKEVVAPNANKGKYRIARCGGPDRDRNSQLISAAPDLYAALSLFMEYNELMDAGDDVAGMLKYAELMEAAPKALAKARGES